MTHLITILDREEWNRYVQKAAQHDFYHTWLYHSLDTSGEPLLFVYEMGESFIAFPLLKRRISGTPYFDLTSVYGYAGPISNPGFEKIREELLDGFKSAFLGFLNKGQKVSVFSRLNPFINQQILIDRFGGIYPNGRTVAIDLTISLEEQRSRYRASIWSTIKQLRKKGFYAREARDLKDIRLFCEIYQENMQRVGATENYFFNDKYFIDLLNSQEFDCRLILVYLNDTAVCGGLITCVNYIIEGHLIGCRTDYLSYSPTKLLVDEISLLGRKSGMKYYHLGGGLSFKEDSLFHWKRGFSNFFLNYNSWRFVADEEKYKGLIKRRGLEIDETVDFFPLYRIPDNQVTNI